MTQDDGKGSTDLRSIKLDFFFFEYICCIVNIQDLQGVCGRFSQTKFELVVLIGLEGRRVGWNPFFFPCTCVDFG